MKRETMYFLLSLGLVIISIVLLIRWEGMISWLLFYLFGVIFIILLFKQIDQWGILNKFYGKRDSFSDKETVSLGNKGIYVSDFGGTYFITWEDIREIVVYTTDYGEERTKFMEISTHMKTYKFHQDTNGWDQLQSRMKDYLPIIGHGNKRTLLSFSNDERVILFQQNRPITEV